jgi:hypothetical protein
VSTLSTAVRDLIVQHFDSAESVEIVMLLRKSATSFWGPNAVAQRLGIREDVATRKMSALAHQNILAAAEQTHAFRYAPSDPQMAARIDALADAYANQRIAVINTIYAANLEKLRAFSSAFKFKKE